MLFSWHELSLVAGLSLDRISCLQRFLNWFGAPERGPSRRPYAESQDLLGGHDILFSSGFSVSGYAVYCLEKGRARWVNGLLCD